MSSKVYTTSTSTSWAKPITAAAQDQGIVAAEYSNINVLDEGAIEDAFDFAKSIYTQNTDSTTKMFDLMASQSVQDKEDSQKMWEFVGKMSTGDTTAGDFTTDAADKSKALVVVVGIILMLAYGVKRYKKGA